MTNLAPFVDRSKLSATSGFAVAFALLVAGLLLTLYDLRAYRAQKLREITLQGQILAASETASLVFEDTAAAQEYLNFLRVNPEIEQAAVYDRAGARIAGYSRTDDAPLPERAPPVSSDSVGGSFLVVLPVIENQRTVGFIFLRAISEPLIRQLPRYGALLLLVTMASLVVVILVTARSALQRRAVELADANAKLMVEMEEREKAEDALRQSQKMEAVGQLTGGIAHDFNNMLAVVIGNLSLLLLRLTQGHANVATYAESAMEGARRAATLTQQLLAFSRRQPLAPVAVNPNKLVSNMSELLRRTLGEHITSETVIAAGVWHIYADQSQLEAAILNLAVNARDAMPQGGTLTIETANAYLDHNAIEGEATAPGQYVMIAVTDTGEGMAPEIAAKAFEPFFTTKPVGKGTGLGLSQVYGFVKQSRGHVKIYSELNYGTTVKLYLPRYNAGDLPGQLAQVERALPKGSAREIILVVEDDERVKRVTVDSLRELGYTVRHSDNAATALRMLEQQPDVTLLFTDIVMPDGNGRVLANEAHRRWPHLKVLYTTGYAKNAIVHNGVLDAGVQLLQKPFSLEQLAAKVREVLGPVPK